MYFSISFYYSFLYLQRAGSALIGQADFAKCIKDEVHI